MLERLNIQQHPELSRINLGNVSLRYSRHAVLRVEQKGIRILSSLSATNQRVVETERENNKTVKYVIRVSYDSKTDLVLVLVRGNLVVTCWLNSKDDQHRTLKLDRITK